MNELVDEIDALRAERDSLAAQLAVAREALKEIDALYIHRKTYVGDVRRIAKAALSKLGGGVMTTSLPRAVEAR